MKEYRFIKCHYCEKDNVYFREFTCDGFELEIYVICHNCEKEYVIIIDMD